MKKLVMRAVRHEDWSETEPLPWPGCVAGARASRISSWVGKELTWGKA
jgi:hypothetical protein